MKRQPTKPRHRVGDRPDVDVIDDQATAALAIVRDRLQPEDDTPEDAAICTLENIIVLAINVFRKTNPSKLRSEAVSLEIQTRLDGKPECLGELVRGPGG